jgi:CRP/FNR family cyclic AMP-dependent transcriptional regulator
MLTESMTSATAADLGRLPLFGALSAADLESIAPTFSVRSYPKNSIIATEGDEVPHLTLILSGRIRQFSYDHDGNEMDLTVLGPGEHLTHAALINEAVLVSSIAVEAVMVATIPAAEFTAVLTRFPALGLQFTRELIRNMRGLVRRAKVFNAEGVYGRVVWLLLRRVTVTDGKRITERMTQADIARCIGATREMVGLVLRDLARGGYIESMGGRFTILKTPPPRR